jgi:hypothetical protein
MTTKTVKARRYDVVNIGTNWNMTPQGFLEVLLTATKVGVFEYQMANGQKRRELCPPEECFREDSLNTLSSCPMANDHPVAYGDGFIHPDNAKKVVVGYLKTDYTIVDNERVDIKGIIMDATAIDDVVNRGKREISPGYEADIEYTPGVWTDPKTGQNFEYDAIQRNRKYNHIAIVDSAREGAEVKIRLDSEDALQYGVGNSRNGDNQRRGEEMSLKFSAKGKLLKTFLEMAMPRFDSEDFIKTLKLDAGKAATNPKVNVGDPVHGEPEKVKVQLGDDAGDTHEVGTAVAAHMQKMHDMCDGFQTAHAALHDAYATLQGKMDSIEAAFNDLKGKHDDSKKENDEMKGRLNSKDIELQGLKVRLDAKDDKKNFQKSVNDRIELNRTAVALMGGAKFKEMKLDEAENVEVMKACIKHLDSKAELDNKSQEFIEGSFGVLKATAVKEKKLDGNGIGHEILAESEGSFETKQAAVQAKHASAHLRPVPGAATKKGAFALTQESQQAELNK